MNISQYKEAIKLCRDADLPLMAWGPGGVGKTRGSEQVSDELNINHIIIQGPLLQPVDLLGLPDRNKDRTIWLRPEILPEEGDGIILIDELPDSAQSMQKAYYQLILEKRVQGHIIPKEWYVMGAGNRPEDGGFSSPMPAPLITRFIHTGVCCECPDFKDETPKSALIDIDDFINYAITNLHPLVVAYLKLKPDKIYNHQATPRTWEYISILLHSTQDHFSFTFKELVKGCIGSAVGGEFNGYIKLATRIPSIEAIMNNPYSIDIPEDKSILYAVVTCLLSKVEDNRIDNIFKFVLRLSNEMQFFFFIQVRRINKNVVANQMYIKWANENMDSLI